MSKLPNGPENDQETEVLRQARAGLGPSPAQRKRTLDRLAATLATAPVPGASVAAQRLFSLRALVTGVVASALVGFAAGALGPWKVTRVGPAPPRTAAPVVILSVPTTTVSTSPAPATPANGFTDGSGRGAPSKDLPLGHDRRAPPPRTAAPLTSNQPETPTLYEELTAVRRAQSALKRGDATLALQLMNGLDESHPGGALLAERRVTKVLALCQLDRTAEATRIANSLLRDNRDAELYRRRLGTSCAQPGISSTNE
jgi:hypothetical protein